MTEQQPRFVLNDLAVTDAALKAAVEALAEGCEVCQEQLEIVLKNEGIDY